MVSDGHESDEGFNLIYTNGSGSLTSTAPTILLLTTIYLAMETPFDTIDQEVLSKILSSEPFVSVEGVPNFRQVGGFQASSGSSSVKSGYLYRSGELSHISDKGKETLRTLGIKKVFDFRAPHETTRFEAPNPTVDTVEFVRAPVTGDEKFDPISIAKLYVDVFLRLSLDLTYLGRLKKFEMNEAEVIISPLLRLPLLIGLLF